MNTTHTPQGHPLMITRLFLLTLASSLPSLAFAHTAPLEHSLTPPLFIFSLIAFALFTFLKTKPKTFALFASLILLSLPSLALAHHPLGGEIPQDNTTGFISGIAHPLIALDHLAFLILAAFTAVLSRSFILFPLAFLVASLAGTLIPLAGISIPYAETLIILSLFVASSLILIKYKTFLPALAVLFGVFHGFAFSEGIIGADTSTFIAYLLGLSLSQTTIIVGGALFFSLLSRIPQLSLHKTSSFASILILGIVLTYVYQPLIDIVIAYV